MNPRITFLGAGNMGGAIIAALLQREILSPAEIGICDHDAEKLKTFASRGIQVSENAEEIVAGAAFIFLAVKPQDAGDLLTQLEGSFQLDAVLISIAAGLSVPFLQEKSGLPKVIRVMPNTPALVQHGVSGVYFLETITAAEREYVEKLLKSFSTVISCRNESQIDAITALSGSGPAYFFRILEIIAKKAEALGFAPDDARTIALETLRGSGELAAVSDQDFSALREKVTSKGGTTAAALQVFAEKGLEEILNAAIEAALQRAGELGK